MNAQDFAETIDGVRLFMFLEEDLGLPIGVAWNGGATFRVFTFYDDAEEVDVFTRYLDEDESGRERTGYRPTAQDAQRAIMEWAKDQQQEWDEE
jgi:hypothetical protein